MENSETRSGPRERDDARKTLRWGQVDLALVELALLTREIEEVIPRVKDERDRDQLRSLESCRAALLRLVARELEVIDAFQERGP